MVKENPNTTIKIIIPKKGKDSLSDDARKKLLEDLESISPEELEAMGNKLEEERNRFDEQIWESIEIWWKPTFKAKNGEKFCIMRGNKKCWGDFDYVWNLKNVWWKPAFPAKKHLKEYIMRWNEQCWDDFDEVWVPIEIGWKPAFIARNGEKFFIIRWNEKFSDDFDEVWNLVDVWWKPAFEAKKDNKQYKIWF